MIYIYLYYTQCISFPNVTGFSQFFCFCLHQKRLDIGLHFGSGENLFTPQRCGCSRCLFGLQQCNNLHICELQETGRVLMRCYVGNVAYEGWISGST